MTTVSQNWTESFLKRLEVVPAMPCHARNGKIQCTTLSRLIATISKICRSVQTETATSVYKATSWTVIETRRTAADMSTTNNLNQVQPFVTNSKL